MSYICRPSSLSLTELGPILYPLGYMLTCVHVCLRLLGHQLRTRATHEQMTTHTCWHVPLHLKHIHLCVQANVMHPLTWIGLRIPHSGAHVAHLQHMSTHCAPATPSTCVSAPRRPRCASVHILDVPCSCIRRSCIWGCLGGGHWWPIVIRWLGSCRHRQRVMAVEHCRHRDLVALASSS